MTQASALYGFIRAALHHLHLVHWWDRRTYRCRLCNRSFVNRHVGGFYGVSPSKLYVESISMDIGQRRAEQKAALTAR
jgi:hypothetical protein